MSAFQLVLTAPAQQLLLPYRPAQRPVCMPENAIRVDPDIRSYIPRHADFEMQRLEADLLAGRLTPEVTIWQETNILLDGHLTYDLCEHHGLAYTISKVSLPDRLAAMEWILDRQYGRRNLTRMGRAYMIGMLYLESEKSPGKRSVEPSGQNVRRLTAAQQIAAKYGEDERTVRRKRSFAEAVVVIEKNCGEMAHRLILSGDAKLTITDVNRLRDLPPKEQAQWLEGVMKHSKVTKGLRKQLLPPGSAMRQNPAIEYIGTKDAKEETETATTVESDRPQPFSESDVLQGLRRLVELGELVSWAAGDGSQVVSKVLGRLSEAEFKRVQAELLRLRRDLTTLTDNLTFGGLETN